MSSDYRDIHRIADHIRALAEAGRMAQLAETARLLDRLNTLTALVAEAHLLTSHEPSYPYLSTTPTSQRIRLAVNDALAVVRCLLAERPTEGYQAAVEVTTPAELLAVALGTAAVITTEYLLHGDEVVAAHLNMVEAHLKQWREQNRQSETGR